MQFEYADFFMQEMRLNNLQCHAVMPSSRSVAAELFVHARTSKLPVRRVFLFRSLTDPIPESATESLPVFVWLLGSAPSTTGKLILDVIGVVVEPF